MKKILSLKFDGRATTVCFESDGDVTMKTYNRNMSIDEVKADIEKGEILPPKKKHTAKVKAKKNKKEKVAKKEKVKENPFEEKPTKKSVTIDGGTELKL